MTHHHHSAHVTASHPEHRAHDHHDSFHAITARYHAELKAAGHTVHVHTSHHHGHGHHDHVTATHHTHHAA